jgi:hypothetical protein
LPLENLKNEKNLLLVKDLKGDIKYHPSGEKTEGGLRNDTTKAVKI